MVPTLGWPLACLVRSNQAGMVTVPILEGQPGDPRGFTLAQGAKGGRHKRPNAFLRYGMWTKSARRNRQAMKT